MNILVTGGDGQLGKCLKEAAGEEKDHYIFLSHKDIDVVDEQSVKEAFDKYRPDVVINCAAYTDVAKAEKEKKKAYEVNFLGVLNLTKYCTRDNCTLIHFSTDYVFDGKKNAPYTEEDAVSPLNVYGCTKLSGEMLLYDVPFDVLVLRISWLYSLYGKNFYKTIKEKIANGEKLKVVNDQFGTPTNGHVLAKDVVTVVRERLYKGRSGVYHYSGLGSCSWYDFACAIAKKFSDVAEIEPISTPKGGVVRPAFSVLEKKKFSSTFRIDLHWWGKDLEAIR